MNVRKYFEGLMISWGIAGCCGFSACTSEVSEEIYFWGTVKTEFALSVPEQQKGSRMTQDIVQEGEFEFRGLENMLIYPCRTKGPQVNTNSNQQINPHDMDGLEPLPESTPQQGFQKGGKNAIWYKDIEIPEGTNTFLVYAEAKKAAGAQPHENGVLTMKGLNDFKQVKFELQSIHPNGLKEQLKVTADKYLAWMNQLLSVKGTFVEGGAEEKEWRYVTPEENANYYSLFRQYLTTTAGSAQNILATMEKLYNQLEDLPGTLKTNLQTKIYNAVGTAPSNGNIFNITRNGNKGAYQLTYTDSEDALFPTQFDLPAGLMVMDFGTSKLNFYYVEDGRDGVTPIDNVAYPTSLYYKANTPLVALEIDHTSLLAKNTWQDLITFYKPQGSSEVVTGTKSILLEKPLEYAVGLLQTNVRIGQNLSTLKDNNPTLPNGDNIPIPTAGLKMTGLLIGKQQNVDWEFHSKESVYGAIEPTYTVYDRVMIPTTVTPPTPEGTYVVSAADAELKAYTLVTETPGAFEENIVVALEFENNTGQDFYGINNKLIPEGTKFYLLGRLEITKQSETDPNKQFTKIFIQDHKTTANFTINSLKNAYNVIPDLRTPILEMGLAVDIHWNQGLDFGVDMETK